MASAGVSRSGRVRRKSAKLMDMIETDPQINNNQIIIKNPTKGTPNVVNNSLTIGLNDSSIDGNKSDSDSTKPLNKKLKIKLSLNPSPVITSEDSKSNEKWFKIEDNLSESADSLPKKATIPPLKIPKTKITGLLSNTGPEVVSTKKSTPELVEEIKTMSSGKTKKVKNQININSEVIESKPQTKEINETKNEMIESIPEVIVESTVKVDDQIELKTADKPIEEMPKVSKVLKSQRRGEEESAANRLFRQITSGVPVSGKGKGNKRNKSLPLEDVTQITFDDEFEETSLIIETEDMVKPNPKKRSRPKANSGRRTKRGKNAGEDKPKKKRNAVITAYMIWSKEHRSKIQQSCPELDFADVSRRLGEIWQSMPEKDKISWRRKAQKLVAKGSSIISTGKPKASPQTSKASNPLVASGSVASGLVDNNDYNSYSSVDDSWQPVGTDPIDVSSHLTLLGESLSIIGQRLKEHSGQIAVSGSLSVLLDSTLCAIGPLLCLTQLDPRLNGCTEETHKSVLENISYIMPGI